MTNMGRGRARKISRVTMRKYCRESPSINLPNKCDDYPVLSAEGRKEGSVRKNK